MKSFTELHESANFRFNGKNVSMASLDSTVSTIMVPSVVGESPAEVHNSKIYVARGKYSGKTVQHVLEVDPSALDKLVK